MKKNLIVLAILSAFSAASTATPSFVSSDFDSAFGMRDVLTMRAEGDYTPDDELKRQWLNAMSMDDRSRLVAVFEDRDRMVHMWRAAGVPCFQVAEGNF